MAARRFLERAFPGESAHIVGVTYRPAVGSAQAIAGIIGAAVLVLAGLGLARRRAVDREQHALG